MSLHDSRNPARDPPPKDATSVMPRRLVTFFFISGHTIISSLFVVCAFALIAFAMMELWGTLVHPEPGASTRARFGGVLESIGLLTIAVAALELGQTILEEEVQRQSHMSAPTRVRRFLSRFMVVIVVSLSIETLVAVFQVTHEEPARLPQAASVGFAAAALLIGWAVFVKLNTGAEKLEPEAMAHAKGEDEKMQD